MNEKINVVEREECVYDILSSLMRSNRLKAVIHCSDKQLLDSVKTYFISLNVPCLTEDEFKTASIGYCFTERLDSNLQGKHILINLNDCKNAMAGMDYQYDVSEVGIEDIEDLEINLDEVPIHLRNDEIRRMFLYSFKCAKKEIDIISPWISRQVVIKSGIADLMEKCLDRGVLIRIIYGIGTEQKAFSASRNVQSEEVAEYLNNRFERFGKRFVIRRDNIHYKLCLCDELYKLEGGFNYLSFPANYEDKNTWKEGSPFGRDEKEIRLLRETYFGEANE